MLREEARPRLQWDLERPQGLCEMISVTIKERHIRSTKEAKPPRGNKHPSLKRSKYGELNQSEWDC